MWGMSAHAGWKVPTFTVGDRLKKARELAGYEQGDFAELIGVSKSTVSNHERDITRPKVIVLRAWAMATGVPMEWLETGKEPPAGPPSGPDESNGWAPWGSNPQPTDCGYGLRNPLRAA